ncbi:MAG: lipopolysaccharide biosynthesis [Rhodobacteraceae bacterium]|jgi:polysaccharide chain length determinant protein (PEP-CTERM system associated)|uniref:GumC family protein n=1 Tax=Albidovulum sp. TaxID=1872424 RepID=UPI001D463654|nr:GNVR domain-containing protein [uncultured Defluviimonas sp.]MCB2124945.1 lipopolysaccharide biosynthesis [Paracoccaceae bacterium]MCC0070932.1 lipopolysaccharide biosynthesis [Paracoccaceae bacterium]
MNLDLSFYFAVFLRRLPYFIIIFALVSAAAIAAAFLLPPVYRANSVLLVESSQIPGALAAPTVQAQALEKLQTIENRLMTRTNLLDIAQRLKVFKDMAKMTPDDIVGAMRKNTRITKSAGRGQATIMTVEFEGESGPVVAGVVNEYVTLILNEDVATRTERAETTVDFFDQEVKRLSGELDAMSAKILDFQNQNADALPNTLQYRLGQQTLLQNTLATAERDISLLKDQKQQMIALFNATGQITGSTANQTPEAQQLAQLRQQMNTFTATYSPTNPKVRQLQAQIDQLEEIVKAQQLPAGVASTQMSPLDIQLASLDTQIGALEAQREQLLEQLAVLKDSIDRTPANQIALDALNRDYTNVQQQYNTAVARQAQASAGEQIEIRSKGERISVVDAATVPDRPVKPDRMLIAGGGVVAGAGLGIAVIVLMELLNRAVRRPKDLINAFGITPIATIPYMRTPSETMMRRSGFAAMLLVAVIGIPAIVYAVHAYYQPLDVLFGKVMTKLGIRL